MNWLGIGEGGAVHAGPKFRSRFLLKGGSRHFCSEQINVSCKVGSNHIWKPLGSSSGGHSKEVLVPGRREKPTTRTKLDSVNAKTQSSKQSTIKSNELVNEMITAESHLIMNKSTISRTEGCKYCDVQPKSEPNLQQLVTIVVFDIETTGLSRNERIIEIALRDLRGGENSTFQTLVNPEQRVPNSDIHGIATNMVNKPSVPRFQDLIPILQHFIQSRRISSAPVYFVGHNARNFDVPFLINEFSRCSEEIPSDWLFIDTLPLARELAKLDGLENLPGKSIRALREFFKIPLWGDAHRAMSDVHSLSWILRAMTIALKMPVSSLLDRAFTASDVIKSKKKTTKKK
ncbi:hypothetical protein Syun_008005 [Stephania yunnanensis]|uniref:Exonuclease domain-containing protein n=1 Tax=Stephania yunnanensis TaxID=152371 RepID=A0AAP0Q0S6_9MAGN